MNVRSTQEEAGGIARFGRGVASGAAGSWRAFAFLVAGLWRAFAFVVVRLWRAFVFSLSWMPPTLALIRFWFRRTSAIVDKEMRQLFRERLTLGMIVGLPLIQIVLFGYAINSDVRHMPAGLVDHADTSMSRQLAGALEASQVLEFVSRSGNVTSRHAVSSHSHTTRRVSRGSIISSIWNLDRGPTGPRALSMRAISSSRNALGSSASANCRL